MLLTAPANVVYNSTNTQNLAGAGLR